MYAASLQHTFGNILSAFDLTTLQPGQTAVIVVDDPHKDLPDRQLEITVTRTTFTQWAEHPMGGDTNNMAVRITAAHVAIVRLYPEDRVKDDPEVGHEFGALSPSSEVKVDERWWLECGTHYNGTMSPFVRSITVFL